MQSSCNQSKPLINEQIIERVRRDNCFDFLRYFFAFSLILVHFCTLTDTEQFWLISGQTRVKAFFTITGFLVVYSYLRHDNINKYIEKRVRRIIPAYITVVLFCLIAGTLFTPVNLKTYITETQTYQYLAANLSMMNFLQPSLPGLFPNNYETAVNGSLWSMKYEVIFYILIPPMIFLMRKFSKLSVILAVFIFHILYHYILDCLEYYYPDNDTFYMLNNASFNTMIYFFSGTALILYFDLFCKYIKFIFPVCVSIIILFRFDIDLTPLYYIEPIVFSAIIIGIAYFFKPLNFLQRFDNISYGLYLYHYPIIQVLVLFNVHKYNLYLAFLLTILLTTLFAIVSWRLIEKPLLKRKVS